MISSLYIHIPFCQKKCIYCDFFSVPLDEALAMKYIGGIIAELGLRRDSMGKLETVYIGGGTPTIIPALSIVLLMKKIKDVIGSAAGAEITIEGNPGTVTREAIQAYVDSGINRFSLGIQSFDNDELKLLGRIHTLEDTLKALALARQAGMGNISIDLIYGIPGQNAEGWARNVSAAVEIMPEHISAYELTPEKGTRLYEAIRGKEMEKPAEEAIVGMYYHLIDRLTDAGYRHYEISNFARPGFECRHNLNYWDRGEYIGAGAAAHSFIGNKRVNNVADISRYIELIKAGELPIDREIEISRDDAIKESVFLGLRKTEGIDIQMFRDGFGIDIAEASLSLMDAGLLTYDGSHLRLTRPGIVVSNEVIVRLLEKMGL